MQGSSAESERCARSAQALGHVRLFATPGTVAHRAPLSMEFSRQESWSGLLFPSLGIFPACISCIFLHW